MNLRLAGSRYFAKRNDGVEITPDTDWDLYAQDSEDTREILRAIGFRLRTDNPVYLDNDTTAIYTLGNVQVSLRKNAEMVSEVLSEMTTEDYIQYVWKSGPSAPKRADIQQFLNERYVAKANSVPF